MTLSALSKKLSKYIEVHFHFVNESYENKEIDITKVGSENNAQR